MKALQVRRVADPSIMQDPEVAAMLGEMATRAEADKAATRAAALGGGRVARPQYGAASAEEAKLLESKQALYAKALDLDNKLKQKAINSNGEYAIEVAKLKLGAMELAVEEAHNRGTINAKVYGEKRELIQNREKELAKLSDNFAGTERSATVFAEFAEATRMSTGDYVGELVLARHLNNAYQKMGQEQGGVHFHEKVTEYLQSVRGADGKQLYPNGVKSLADKAPTQAASLLTSARKINAQEQQVNQVVQDLRTEDDILRDVEDGTGMTNSLRILNNAQENINKLGLDDEAFSAEDIPSLGDADDGLFSKALDDLNTQLSNLKGVRTATDVELRDKLLRSDALQSLAEREGWSEKQALDFMVKEATKLRQGKRFTATEKNIAEKRLGRGKTPKDFDGIKDESAKEASRQMLTSGRAPLKEEEGSVAAKTPAAKVKTASSAKTVAGAEPEVDRLAETRKAAEGSTLSTLAKIAKARNLPYAHDVYGQGLSPKQKWEALRRMGG